MLFVMRTWALVRSVNRALGGTARERFLIIADAASAGGAARADAPRGAGAWLARVRQHCALLRTRLLLHAWDLAHRLLWQLRALQPHSSRELG